MPPFKDPIAPKRRVCDKQFKAPTKEVATTGRFMSAGDNYGSGFKLPVGKFSASNEGPILMKSKSFNPNDAVLDV